MPYFSIDWSFLVLFMLLGAGVAVVLYKMELANLLLRWVQPTLQSLW